MITLLIRLSVLLLIVSVLAGCATPTQTVRLIESDGNTGAPIQRVLILEVAGDREFRHSFEDELARHLGNSGVETVRGHTVVRDVSTLTRADIDRHAQDQDADAVLVSQLVRLETSIETSQGREDIVRTCRKGGPIDHFLYDSVVIKEPESAKLSLSAVVITQLFRPDGEAAVWAIQSTCFKKDSVLDVVSDEVTAIVRQLEIDGLI